MDIVKTAELKAAGVPGHVIDLRCRPGGPWQRILPGVLLLGAQPPTRAQRLRAAVAYAGPGAVITGADALAAQGLPARPPAHVHLLQPASRRRSGGPRLVLERTTRPPGVVVRDGLPFTEPTRAVLDAARHEPHPLRRHHVLAGALRAGLCTVEGLNAELEAGNRRGTAATRSALRLLAATLR
ncbi:hypothetical protein [Saccharothrix sp. Mg75]|uniref:hypothetical protein n=1 Tax=Saccharothrix sp. Mg75 TaxID=3445357 RepID=UPI003EEAEE29